MKLTKKLFRILIQPFQSGNKYDIGLILVYLLINGLVFVNAYLHDPRIGYDATENFLYIQTLSQLRLVTPQDSSEFFSAPLPYAIPALLISLTGMKVFLAAKLAQFLNFFLSIGVTWYLIKTCHLINSRSSLKLGSLFFLGIFPVYYKTFAFVRGEPYVVFFAVVILYYTLLIYIEERFTVTAVTILGGAMGLCALSRQWGILLLPSVFLFLVYQWIRFPRWRSSITKAICLLLVLIFVISGWFYISLKINYGSSTAFNKSPEVKWALSNQPLEFYFGLNPRLLFSNPIRPNFPNQFLPIFYSELWGDYWGYFTIYGRDTRDTNFLNGSRINKIISNGEHPNWLETNYETIGGYLGRVNLISLFPSVLVLVSLVNAAFSLLLKQKFNPLITHQREVYSFLLLAIGMTMVGYFWFLILYPSIGKGDTIKATYVVQVIPFIAILVGILLEHVKKKSHSLYRLVMGGLIFCFFHNISAMITHYQFY